MSANELYREFDHTGDLGIEVEAASRAELFARTVIALARVMVEEQGIRAREKRRIEARADDDPDLLHDLLAAGLNAFLIDAFIWRGAAVTERDGAIAATLEGEPFDPHRHRLLTEIKAVTYHRLKVEHQPGRWRATVVFDV